MKISAKTKAKPTPITIEYNMPEKLDGLVKFFGEDVVAAAAKGQLVISIQAAMRRMLMKDKPQGEIQTSLATWKPDVRTVVKQTAFEKATSALDKLSSEERQALLHKLQAGAGAQAKKAA